MIDSESVCNGSESSPGPGASRIQFPVSSGRQREQGSGLTPGSGYWSVCCMVRDAKGRVFTRTVGEEGDRVRWGTEGWRGVVYGDQTKCEWWGHRVIGKTRYEVVKNQDFSNKNVLDLSFSWMDKLDVFVFGFGFLFIFVWFDIRFIFFVYITFI